MTVVVVMDDDLAWSLSDLASRQLAWTEQWHHRPRDNEAEPPLSLVQENHWHNFSLWHHEDQARRDDMGSDHVYQAKRAIDQHNQLRNNAMEAMDSFFVAALRPDPHAPLNSETPGMMLDRLSILALKEYHMKEETVRTDAAPDHVERCRHKLQVIREQRTDLERILTRFLEEVRSGHRGFKVYFQFKMYNDPNLNPELYRRKS